MAPAGPGKKLCGAKTKKGTCQNVAGKGTQHLGFGRCSRHGGNTESHVKAAEVEQAVEAVAYYGLPREVEPHQALIEELYRTAGHVQWLEDIIHAGEMTKDVSPTGRRRGVKLDQATLAGDIPSVWLDLYERERKHLKDVAKTCLSLGLEDRRVKLDEAIAQKLVKFARGLAKELGVENNPELPVMVRRQLTLVAGQAA